MGDAAAARAAAEVAAANSSGDEEERDRGKPRCDSCGKAVKVVRVRWGGFGAIYAARGASTGTLFDRRGHVLMYLKKQLYTRLEYIYCSTDCVQNHKRALLAEAAMRRLGGGGK